MRPTHRRALAALLGGLLAVPMAALPGAAEQATTQDHRHDDELVARAVLDAHTFADGPPAGAALGDGPINGVEVPFDGQPVQGFSAVLDLGDGTFLALSDNGFGNQANSADYHLRLYRIRPRFEVAPGHPLPAHLVTGDGDVEVLDWIELRDPNGHITWATVNHFTDERILTGADFDIESVQMAEDGTLWIGDEFGPFLLHVAADGVLLEPPIPLDDPDGEGDLRSPQSPLSEESSTLRVMNAVRTHARLHGGDRTPVVSPSHEMLADGDPTTVVSDREDPPEGLARASSEIHDVAALHEAGFDVVPYTVNDPTRMAELLELGVDGLISDRPDLLYRAVAGFDADDDGTPGDYLLPDGRIDPARVDAQGHRGGRDLRPENTLPAMEVALDHLMTTLELDAGVTADGVAVLDHDPLVESGKCRRGDGTPYGEDDEVLVRDLTAAELQAQFVCDGLVRGPEQGHDPALSPVTAAFAAEHGLPDPYAVPTLQQVLDFVAFYQAWYSPGGGGSDEADAEVRAANAAEVRFNVETKLNPRAAFADRTAPPQAFVDAVAGTIAANGLADRADVQSFDWRTLLLVHEQHPEIRTVFLFGDFPQVGDAGDGTNLQDEDGATSPWLAGLSWPYRVTAAAHPFEVQGSGGFEGMAISPNGRRLYPLLEKPLARDDGFLRLLEFDVDAGAYTGRWWRYELDERGEAIGDFVLFTHRDGLVIERDNTQGDLGGFKAIYEIRIPATSGEAVEKVLAVDLLDIADLDRLSEPARPGDVGLGEDFAFPFVTIEDVVVLGPDLIGVMNDNNYPFSVGRHVGEGTPDDTELVVVDLADELGTRFATTGGGDPGEQVLAGPFAPVSDEAFSFALLGDTPYGQDQLAAFPGLVADVNAEPGVDFVVHVGDIKAGSQRCDDELYHQLRGMFDAFADPFVLTPGDNDWTDCHRESNGRYVPTERLDRVREIFFPTPGTTLGAAPVDLVTQASSPAHAAYRENLLWQAHQVVFSTLHVVGSDNGLAPWDGLEGGDLPAVRMGEYVDRLEAALAWIDQAFDTADENHAAGVVLAMQANPVEVGPSEGFTDILDAVVARAADFGKPVLLAHGDFHYLIVDQPFEAAPNVTRVQTFGEEATNWLVVTVDPTSEAVFGVEGRQAG